MKQFLIKALEITRRSLAKLVEIGQWIVGLLRSVEIDRPRGALLSVALQVLVLVLLALMALPSSPPQSIQPLSGSVEKANSTQASGSGEEPVPNAPADSPSPQ